MARGDNKRSAKMSRIKNRNKKKDRLKRQKQAAKKK